MSFPLVSVLISTTCEYPGCRVLLTDRHYQAPQRELRLRSSPEYRCLSVLCQEVTVLICFIVCLLLLIFRRVILFVPQSHFVQVKVPDPRCHRSCPPGWDTPQTSPILRMKRSRMRNRRDLVQKRSSHLKMGRRRRCL